MAMASPMTTAMINRTTTLLVVRDALRHGEGYRGAPPRVFPEVGGHDPGHVAAGRQPGEGGAIMVRGGGRRAVRLARPVQVDEVAQARAGIGPAQPDLAGSRAGPHRGH